MDKLPLNSNTDDQQNAKPSFKSQRLSFFWFLAAADEDLLRECPSTEQYKQASIGAAILFTAVAAALSGFFAFLLLLKYWFIALPVAIFWSMLIFNLDRFMVGSMRKDPEGNKWREIKMAAPRLLLATLIALLISRPIEVEIFKPEIEAEQLLNKQDYRKKVTKNKQEEIEEAKSAKKELLVNVKDLEKQKECANAPGYQKAHSEWELCEKNLNKLVERRNKEIEKEKRLEANIQRNIGTSSPDVNGNLAGNEPPKIESPQLNNIRFTIQQLNRDIEQLNCYKEKSEYEAICNDFIASINERIHQTIKEVDTLSILITKDRKEKNQTGILADSLNQRKIEGFLGKLEALESAKANNSTIRYSSWFIMLLFFILEIAPLIVKILVERSAYDSLLQLKEQKIIFNSETDLSELKSNAERRLRILQDDDGKLLETERQMNKDVMEKIRDAQTEVSFKLIEAWKDEEREKIEKNRTKSVKERVKTSK